MEEKKNEKRINEFLDDLGISLDSISYLPITTPPKLLREEFIEAFSDIFFIHTNAFIVDVFNDREELRKFAGKYLSLVNSDEEEFLDNLTKVSKKLKKNKENKRRLLKNYLKSKDLSIAEESVKVIREFVKSSLYIEHLKYDNLDNKHLTFIPKLQDWKGYGNIKQSIASDFLEDEYKTIYGNNFKSTISNDEEFYTEEPDELSIRLSLTPGQSLIVDDNVELIEAKNLKTRTNLFLNNIPNSKKLACQFLKTAKVILEDLIEDNVSHLSGMFLRYIINFTKELDDESRDNTLFNFISIDEMNELCKSIYCYKIISPLDILDSMFKFCIFYIKSVDADDNEDEDDNE